MKQSAAKRIAYSAIIAAVLVAVKYVLSFLPNVELVSPLIVIFAASFGLVPTLFGAITFSVLDSLIYGFFPTVALQYFFHFPLLALVSALIFSKRSANDFTAALIVSIAAVLFWVETPIINALLRFSPFLPTLVSGIPFMIPMLVVGFISTLALFNPLKNALTKIERQE